MKVYPLTCKKQELYIPDTGTVCIWRVASVVVGRPSPCLSLAAHINPVFLELLLEDFERIEILRIQIAHYEDGTVGLPFRIVRDGLEHIVGSGSLTFIFGSPGPSIDVVDDHRLLMSKLNPSPIYVFESFVDGIGGEDWDFILGNCKDTASIVQLGI